jgi:hypothetical protein
MRKFYNIYHISDYYSNGNIAQSKKYIGLVEATDEEIKEFLKIWNKPRIYYYIGDRLIEHLVVATPVELVDINKVEPYDPKTRDWPDIPYGMDFSMEWNEKNKSWGEPWYTENIYQDAESPVHEQD